MHKRILTQEDFNNNPILPELGLKVGDEIEIPEENTADNESFDAGADGDDTGGNHPSNPGGKP